MSDLNNAKRVPTRMIPMGKRYFEVVGPLPGERKRLEAALLAKAGVACPVMGELAAGGDTHNGVKL